VENISRKKLNFRKNDIYVFAIVFPQLKWDFYLFSLSKAFRTPPSKAMKNSASHHQVMGFLFAAPETAPFPIDSFASEKKMINQKAQS
jgi:hypothetical protein